ncbi:SigE family RNA polymerase sigma factor [Actinomadura montaniterrae]|uniref:SigE family RNA polymerase sigma factor n=1 Tax=Actinomadura montaniterrae TaxID=1803903 RepID=A0A6L3VZ08_9ACTN|nr:SigE family RNA polymerase sigma factor [Actinomadura montaniterrae]KAB2379256.1 SigE family RNA polymerase sigma factor [Actinomadura montaniterrae]
MVRYDGLPEFVVARGPALLRSAFLLTGDRHLAEDLVQTTLVKLAPRWQRVSSGGDPESYVRKILYNEHLNWWKRRGRHGYPTAAPPEPAGHPDIADRAVRSMLLGQALGRLTAKQRAMIVLRFYEDRSEIETARLLGCSIGTVKSQTHRALARLRALEPGLVYLLTDIEISEVAR